MKVKMLQTRRASPYGGAAEEFRKDETYDLPANLATAFLTDGAALPVRERPVKQGDDQAEEQPAAPQASRRKSR